MATITIDTIQIKRSFTSGTIPASLLEGEEFVNLADGFRMMGDGVTDPADLPRIPFIPAENLPLSQAAMSALLPVQSLGIARADIPNKIISLPWVDVAGFAAPGDYGTGARYIRGTSSGPMAIQDAAGTWFQLDLSSPVMFATWFGIVPGVLTVAQANANRIGLNVAKQFLTTGRKLYLPPGKVALTPDPANINAPAWNLADGTTTSIATTSSWSVLPAGGYLSPAGGEFGGPGGAEFVAVGIWGTGPMVRLNGPITDVEMRLAANCNGLAATGFDIIHGFDCRLWLKAQRYTVNGIVCRTINGPLFSGVTQGFMQCEGQLTATLPATRTAEGVVLRAYEATVAKNDPAYFYQGLSRNCFRIKSEIPGAVGCGAVVLDRIDNNLLPLMFTYPGGNGADAGSGGIRWVPSNDGFFACENTLFAGHILGGMIGQQGSGGNSFPQFSVSDGEQLPTAGVWSTPTGLYGGIRRLYGDDSGLVSQPTYTFNSAQGSGLFLVPGSGGSIGLSAGGVLGVQADTAGRVGLGMAPVAGYGAAIAGDVALAGGSRTVAATSGSFLQLQAPTTIYLTTAGLQQVTADANGIYPATTNRNCGLSNAPWLNVFSAAGTFSGPVKTGTYTVATLPTAGTAGRQAWATNGRALQSGGTLEASGSGTGCLVSDNGSAWRIAGTNITVSA